MLNQKNFASRSSYYLLSLNAKHIGYPDSKSIYSKSVLWKIPIIYWQNTLDIQIQKLSI